MSHSPSSCKPKSAHPAEAPTQRSLVIAGGYSAGHLLPGIATAQAIRHLSPETPCVFIGRADSLEERLVKEAGFPFESIRAEAFRGRSLAGKSSTLAGLPIGVHQARALLSKHRAGAVLALGGFVCAATGLASISKRIPLILREPNIRCGLANGMLKPLCHELWIGELACPALRNDPRARLLGTPLNCLSEADIAPIRAEFQAHKATRILVCGGSLGSTFLNTHASALIKLIQKKLPLDSPPVRVLHLVGEGNATQATQEAYAQAGIDAEVLTHTPVLRAHLAISSAVISAAGAVTLEEIAHSKRPALIVPLEHSAAAHQHENAHSFCKLHPQHTLLGDPAHWNGEVLSQSLCELITEAPTPAPEALDDLLRPHPHTQAIAQRLLELLHTQSPAPCPRA